MKQLMAMVAQLSADQRVELLQLLQAQPAQAQVLSMVESRLDASCAGPRCHGHRSVIRNGHADGLQRFKCRGCGKTFNALSGTPLARLHLKSKWLDQADVLCQGLTVHKAAERLRVAPSTAFRWRHRFLKLPQGVKACKLHGVAEVDETYELRSCKGQRVCGRLSRQRGGKASTRAMSKEHVPVLVARDRSGATTDFVLEAANIAQVSAALSPVLVDDVIVCTDGSPMLASVARALGLEHHALNLTAGIRVRGPWHIQNVNAYRSRFKNWKRRFHGVATSYLPSYLGWFRAMDRFSQSTGSPRQMLALTVGV